MFSSLRLILLKESGGPPGLRLGVDGRFPFRCVDARGMAALAMTPKCSVI
jgi:hypothetical protein